MSFLLDNKVYQYVAITFATMFLVPQTYSGFKSRSLVDVSAGSMVIVAFSSGLWGLYMYKTSVVYYAVASYFVGLNAITLLVMKVVFYYERLNEHLKSFDKPSQIMMCPQCNTSDASNVV